MTAILPGLARIRYSIVILHQTSGFLIRPRPRLGSSWHQSAVSSSDSARFAVHVRRGGLRGIEGLRRTSGSPKRALDQNNVATRYDTNTNYETKSRLDAESQPKRKPRLNNKCIAFVRSSLGLKSKSTRAPRDAIFIAMDTEGTKADLTELGISTLDTRDIQNIDPGPSALNWSQQIRPRQFRFKAGERQPFLFGAVEHRIPLTAIQPYLKLQPDRLYILVGHALNHDIEKLACTLGYELRNESNVVAIVDTYALAQQYRTTLPGRLSKLWRFLVDSSPGDATPADVVRVFSPKPHTASLDFESKHGFHNAGNDAFYNMHTLLMLALQPELLREPQYSSSLAGVFLTARSTAWQLVRRLTYETPGSRAKSIVPGSMVRRPEGVASVQPNQLTSPKELTVRIKIPKT
ncbi:hypothetical protein E4T42_04558 [Aureobasidium subglaciale]|nr:hypothetical protein E4T42_04558 [Aureobasidium subglaciale]